MIKNTKTIESPAAARPLEPLVVTPLLDRIRLALCDPQAPWYGSDLVAWVGDLCDAVEKHHAAAQLENRVNLRQDVLPRGSI